MITQIPLQKINVIDQFTYKPQFIEKACEAISAEITTPIKLKINEIPSENFKAQVKIIDNETIPLIKKPFGFAVNEHSEGLPIYRGPLSRNVGFSTEIGEFGGGWVKGDLDTPLSTSSMHDCAAVNFIDEKSNKHVLFHIYPGSTTSDITEFIKAKCPKFNKANIIPGDHKDTNKTVCKLLNAIKRTNPRSEQKFYHYSSESPEIVAQNGKMSYVEFHRKDAMTFQEVNQYYYAPNEYL